MTARVDRLPADEMAKAKALAEKIEFKAANLLTPLELEMRTMKWRPEYRAIMWSAVVRRATMLLVEAERG